MLNPFASWHRDRAAGQRRSLDAGYRVFVHNPPSNPDPGRPAIRRQNGPYRAGIMEWRTNDRETADRKAQRIVEGADADNPIEPGGWATVDENFGFDAAEGGTRYLAIAVFGPAPAYDFGPVLQ